MWIYSQTRNFEISNVSTCITIINAILTKHKRCFLKKVLEILNY